MVHYVLHALPLALLAVLPRRPWIRHVAAMAGLMWIVMLSLLWPMIPGAMREGIRIGERLLAHTWLAITRLLLAAAWSAVNLSWLSGRTSRWPVWMLAIDVTGVVLGWMQPISRSLFEAPVTRAPDREAPADALLVALALVLALGTRAVVRFATARLTSRAALLANHRCSGPVSTIW